MVLNYYFSQATGFSVLFAAITGAVRYRRILPAFRPFVILMWLAAANELMSIICVRLFHQNTVNGNVYVLIEYAAILILFMRWNEQEQRRSVYALLLLLGLAVWITDNIIWHSVFTFSSLFRIVYSFIVVYLSIDKLNEVIFRERTNLFRNAQFIICLSFIFYYTYKATYETFFLLQMNMSNSFYINTFMILVFVNLFTNLVYAWAMLCIPTKQKFILPY